MPNNSQAYWIMAHLSGVLFLWCFAVVMDWLGDKLETGLEPTTFSTKIWGSLVLATVMLPWLGLMYYVGRSLGF